MPGLEKTLTLYLLQKILTQLYLGELIVTPTVITEQRGNVKENKCSGVYCIPTNFLIQTAEHLIVPLTIIFNLSPKRDIVQEEWNHAIFK